MNALQATYLLGVMPTAAKAFYDEVGAVTTSGQPVTTRQLNHARKSGASTELFDDANAAKIVSALMAPVTDTQRQAAQAYNCMKEYFGGGLDDLTTPMPEPEEIDLTTEDLDLDDSEDIDLDLDDSDEDLDLGDDDLDLGDDLELGDDGLYVGDDDLDLDLDDDDGLGDLLDTDTVDADPISYDRTALEKDTEGNPPTIFEDQDDDDLGDLDI